MIVVGAEAELRAGDLRAGDRVEAPIEARGDPGVGEVAFLPGNLEAGKNERPGAEDVSDRVDERDVVILGGGVRLELEVDGGAGDEIRVRDRGEMIAENEPAIGVDRVRGLGGAVAATLQINAVLPAPERGDIADAHDLVPDPDEKGVIVALLIALAHDRFEIDAVKLDHHADACVHDRSRSHIIGGFDFAVDGEERLLLHDVVGDVVFADVGAEPEDRRARPLGQDGDLDRVRVLELAGEFDDALGGDRDRGDFEVGIFRRGRLGVEMLPIRALD